MNLNDPNSWTRRVRTINERGEVVWVERPMPREPEIALAA